MKSVHLKEVQQDKDSNQWLYEEVLGMLLICPPSLYNARNVDHQITHIQKHKQ